MLSSCCDRCPACCYRRPPRRCADLVPCSPLISRSSSCTVCWTVRSRASIRLRDSPAISSQQSCCCSHRAPLADSVRLSSRHAPVQCRCGSIVAPLPPCCARVAGCCLTCGSLMFVGSVDQERKVYIHLLLYPHGSDITSTVKFFSSAPGPHWGTSVPRPLNFLPPSSQISLRHLWCL